MERRLDKLAVGSLLTLLAVSFFIYVFSQNIEKKYENKVVKDMVMMIGSFFNNIEREIFKMVKDRDIVEFLIKNREARKHIESLMAVLVTPEVHYVYALYIDKKGKLRFLIDASKEDKALLGEKFDILIDAEKWYEAINKQKPVVIVYENPIAIGATFIKPVVQNGKTKLLLVADFSIHEIKEIRGYFGAIRTVSQASAFLSLIMLYIAVFQYYRRRKLEKKLYIDQLTGLYNRNFLEKEFSNVYIGDYYLVLIDLDNFRKVNATYGESVGDKIIKRVAELLKEEFKNSVIIRYAGEEFLILIPKYMYTNKERFREHLDSVRRKIKNLKISADGFLISVTVSMGANVSTEREKSLEEALKNADRALYRAKKEGKDRVEIYDIAEEEKELHLSISEVIDAIENNRLFCFYQGIYHIKTKKAVYYESLARIKGKDGRIYSPAFFLEEIRGTFAYIRFVKEILRINTELLMRNEELRISINLSPSDLLDYSIVEMLKDIDEDICKRIYLEITESEGIPSFEKIEKVVEELRNKGYKLGIDDFGSGYSNLINLAKMKIDFLKIDGSLIVDIPKSESTYLLVKSIVDFCKKMNIKVVAEFVENEIIVEKLKELGIDYAQGYFFDRPRPPEELMLK